MKTVEVVTSMNRSAVHQLPVQLEVHELHFKNMRGKNSVKDKALFIVDFKAFVTITNGVYPGDKPMTTSYYRQTISTK